MKSKSIYIYIYEECNFIKVSIFFMTTIPIHIHNTYLLCEGVIGGRKKYVPLPLNPCFDYPGFISFYSKGT